MAFGIDDLVIIITLDIAQREKQVHRRETPDVQTPELAVEPAF